jgi:hypothetical protein
MSWIISLSDAKQNICFSNEYAGRLLRVSTPTITRAIARLKTLGFINTFQPLGDKRFIHLLNRPEIEDISIQVCDLEGVINLTTPPNQNDYTPNQNEETPSSQRLDPLINMITNNKEDNKDYNTQHTTNEILIEWKEDKRFCKVASMFPENKLKEVKRAYDYFWLFLPENDKLEIERTLPTYIQRNQSNKNYIKQIDKYFESRFWITDETTLSLLKPKQVQPKRFIF